jgi:hypothetical protein
VEIETVLHDRLTILLAASGKPGFPMAQPSLAGLAGSVGDKANLVEASYMNLP